MMGNVFTTIFLSLLLIVIVYSAAVLGIVIFNVPSKWMERVVKSIMIIGIIFICLKDNLW